MILIEQAELPKYEPAIGVDDFQVWPCHTEELLARLRQMLRRAGIVDGNKLIKVGKLSIAPEQYKVWVAGVPVTLTFKEFELAKLLASSPGRVFSREQLLSMVWGYDYFGGDRTVDVHIRRLRSKIEAWGHSYIETVRNVGYRFREQP
ncbi:MAG: response regulator transcription factor [Chloroflexi bacterium]|nr:response regulator transcription factor [Chloroflexota bacterium]